MLVKIFCWRSHVSNLSIFKKITSVLHHYQRKTERSAFTWQGMLQRKSRNISLTVAMDFWWLTESPDEVQTLDSQKFQGGEDLLRHI